jgi:hypothetical protein
MDAILSSFWSWLGTVILLGIICATIVEVARVYFMRPQR